MLGCFFFLSNIQDMDDETLEDAVSIRNNFFSCLAVHSACYVNLFVRSDSTKAE